MESYCLKCKKDTKNIDPEVSSTSNGRAMILSKCAICGSKLSRFIKNQEVKGLLSKLGIKTKLSKIPILGEKIHAKLNRMNEIINKILSAGDKFMPEMHLKQPGFTYSACGPFTKKKERIQKFKKTGDTNYIYKNELDKACFQHDMAYGDFKDLKRRTFSDKVLRDKAFNIAKNPKYDGYQRGLGSMVYNFFDKKSKGSVIANEPNYQLANELHKLIIRTFKNKNSFFRI